MEAILLSVLDGLAANKYNPNYFLIPTTITVCLAFLFPISSSINMVVYACGYIKIKDMLVTGLILKLTGAIVVNIAANLWLDPIFKDPRLFDTTTTTLATLTSMNSTSLDQFLSASSTFVN